MEKSIKSGDGFPRYVAGYICSNGGFHEYEENSSYQFARECAEYEEAQITLADVAAELCLDGEYELVEALTIHSNLEQLKKFSSALEILMVRKMAIFEMKCKRLEILENGN